MAQFSSPTVEHGRTGAAQFAGHLLPHPFAGVQLVERGERTPGLRGGSVDVHLFLEKYLKIPKKNFIYFFILIIAPPPFFFADYMYSNLVAEFTQEGHKIVAAASSALVVVSGMGHH